MFASNTQKAQANDWDCTELHEVVVFEPAPCSGSLIPHFQADEAIRLKLVDFPALQEEFRLYKLEADQNMTEVLDELKIEQGKNTKLSVLLDKNLNPPDPPFYKTFWFGASVGVVTTILIVVAVNYAGK